MLETINKGLFSNVYVADKTSDMTVYHLISKQTMEIYEVVDRGSNVSLSASPLMYSRINTIRHIYDGSSWETLSDYLHDNLSQCLH